MKTIKIILATFAIAFLTSGLYEFPFVAGNPVRYALVLLLILVEIISGFLYLKTQFANNPKPKQDNE